MVKVGDIELLILVNQFNLLVNEQTEKFICGSHLYLRIFMIKILPYAYCFFFFFFLGLL